MGAAVVRDGRVLACRRTSPREAAGRWEFPGGKVEDGESPDAAIVRELAEELRVEVTVNGWLDGVAAIGDTHQLRVALATVADGAEPDPVEHDATRWLGAHELGEVDWLEPDRPFLPRLAAYLETERRGGRGCS